MKMSLLLAPLLLVLNVYGQSYPTVPMKPGQSAPFYDYNTRQNVVVQCGYGNLPPPPPRRSVILTITCDPYTNAIMNLNSQGGDKLAEYKMFMGSENACQTMKSQILKYTDSGRLFNSKKIAICDPYTNMLKIDFSLESNTIKDGEKTFLGSAERCNSQAEEFNSQFAN